MDVGVGILALAGVFQIAVMLPQRVGQEDFHHYYAWSHMMQAGANPYTANAAPFYQQNGLLPFAPDTPHATATPLFLRVFSAIAWMPPRLAFAACAAAQVASLVFILAATRRLLTGRLSQRGWWFVCAGAVLSPVVFWHFYASHLELLMAALMLAAYQWHRAGRHAAACVAATVAGLMKLFPLMLVPWFVWRSAKDWRGRARHAAWVLGAAGGIMALSGGAWWLDFFNDGLAVVREWAIRPQHFSYSVPSLIVTLNYVWHGMAPSPAAVAAGWQVAQASGLVVIGAACVACCRRAGDAEAEFCLLTTAMLASGGLVWGYYFVFLIFPAAVAAARVAARFTERRLLALAIILLLLNDVGTWSSGRGADNLYLKSLLNTPPIFGLLGLGVFFLGEQRAIKSSAQPA
jgi:hypothetical protein